MSTVRRQLEVDMLLGNYAENTRRIYLDVITSFEDHFGSAVEEAGIEDIRTYLHHLVERNLSESSLKQAYSALKLITETTLGKEWNVRRIPRARKKKGLPILLSQPEVEVILHATANPKYRAIFITIYSAGLRTGEVARLKITDIDSAGMRIRVNQGKGSKDRFTLLAQTTLDVLRAYWKTCRPPEWLFTPENAPDRHISVRSIQAAFHDAVKKAGIGKPASVRALRHAFATHFYEETGDLSMLQELLGHANLNTTRVYLHLSRTRFAQVKSPIDLWPSRPLQNRQGR